MRLILGLLQAGMVAALSGTLAAQTAVDLRAQSRNVDFSGAVATKPFKTGVTLPAVCSAGETFFKTDAPAGHNLYACTATNTWSGLAGSVGAANSGPGAAEVLKTGISGPVTARQIVTGEGSVVTQQEDTVTVETDTAIIPRYASASTAPSGACQTGRDQYTRVSGFPHFYNCVGGLWKPVYAVASAPPVSCMVGELYFNSADGGLYGCTAADTWVRFNASGVDLSAAGECFITYSCSLTPAHVRTALPAAAVAGNMIAVRIVLPNTVKLHRALMYFNNGPAGTRFTAAIYANNSGAPGPKIAGTDLSLDASTSGYKQGVWGSGAVVLNPGVYWVGMSSESSVTQFHLAGGGHSQVGTMMAQLTTNRPVAACSNPVTGAGATYLLPDTCGTGSAVSGYTDAPVIVAAAQ